MGGSFGGYMANWVAGHTDRFDAIVSHASLWALDQFGATTDASYYWLREMTRDMATANSPHHFVGRIRTPMLVIHGDKDYRVPIGEALRLWFELLTGRACPQRRTAPARTASSFSVGEPLGAHPAAREDLVPGGDRVPGPPCAGRGRRTAGGARVASGS